MTPRAHCRQRTSGHRTRAFWCPACEPPRPSRQGTSRRCLQLTKPRGEVAPPYPELSVGQLERGRPVSKLPPAVESAARDAAQLVQDLANGHQLVATGVHVG